MKIVAERAPLLSALDRAVKIVERRNTIPILSNVLLAAKRGSMQVCSTDLDMELATSVPVSIQEAGATTVPAAILQSIVKKAPEGSEIVLDAPDDASQMTVKYGRSRYSLNTLPSGDYPDITVGEFKVRFQLQASELVDLIQRTSFAISTEETRYYLNGIHLHVSEDMLVAVATDGHRLSRFMTALPEGAAGMPGVIVPRKAVKEIEGLATAAGKGQVTFEVSDAKIRLTAAGSVFTSKLIDGTFPDYHRVIPSGSNCVAILSRADFAAAVDRVSTMSQERGRASKLHFDDAGTALNISVLDADVGSANEEVPVLFSGPSLITGFNSKYLLEALGVMKSTRVRLEMSDPGSAALMRGEDEADKDSIIVLMPMRV